VSSDGARSRWLFFTNHFQVLLTVAREPDGRLRTIADEVGITERAAHRILTDLAREGYISVAKHGRRNHYRVNPGTRLRHPGNDGIPLEPLVELIIETAGSLRTAARLQGNAQVGPRTVGVPQTAAEPA
jgi:predicted ArsR family transcriptional regulator